MKYFMKYLSSLITMILLSMTYSTSYADRYVPSHLCFKPEKPLFLASSYQRELYNKDVSAYKFCIRDFVKGQEVTITLHQQAIKKATSDWNEFVEEDK